MIENFSPEEAERILQALYAGRLVEAVKLYRAGTNCDLKTAVDFIHQLDARLRQESPEKFSAKALQWGSPRVMIFMAASFVIAAIAAVLASRAKQAPKAVGPGARPAAAEKAPAAHGR